MKACMLQALQVYRDPSIEAGAVSNKLGSI